MTRQKKKLSVITFKMKIIMITRYYDNDNEYVMLIFRMIIVNINTKMKMIFILKVVIEYSNHKGYR